MGDAYEGNIRKSIWSVLDIEIEFKSNLKKSNYDYIFDI